MTQLQLIQHISGFENTRFGKLRSKLKEKNFSLHELVDLTFYSDKEIAEKASKILEFILFKFPESYIEDIAYLVEHVAEVKCVSCRKHYAKVLKHLTSPEVSKEVRTAVKEINFEPIVELCFGWLRDADMIVNVKASAAETLFNMRHRYPWIAEALSRDLEAIMPSATPMLKAKGNYILSFLHCED